MVIYDPQGDNPLSPLFLSSSLAPMLFPYSIFLFCINTKLHESCRGGGEEDRKLQRMEEQAEFVGKAFVDHYYHLFDNDRPSLVSLYQPSSMLSFEGQKYLGSDEISAKLNQLPFQQCRHLISTVDSQHSSATGGIVVFVSGCIQLPGEDHHLRFSQMFHLIPTPEGSFFVQNDIFRLNYG